MAKMALNSAIPNLLQPLKKKRFMIYLPSETGILFLYYTSISYDFLGCPQYCCNKAQTFSMVFKSLFYVQ